MIRSWTSFLKFSHGMVEAAGIGRIKDIVSGEAEVAHVSLEQAIFYNNGKLIKKDFTVVIDKESIYDTKSEAQETLISSLFKRKER